MTTNPYLDSGPSFIHEEDERKLPQPSRSEVKPQYVHQVASKPPPEISSSVPKRKGVKQRCVKFTVAAVICLLLLLLVAGILLAYYFSSSCVHGRQCGDGGCVWESQWCDGVTDCPAGQDETNCVRLHGSSFLLQVYSTQSKTWRTVCSHGWTDQQGRASCQQVGYSSGTYFKSGQQMTDSDDGFLIVKSHFNPEASILQQLVLSDTCPSNSVVALHCTDCGRGVNSSRASGGQMASSGAWPWQVSLQVAGSHRCGGAVISPYWIVTAAHCVARASSPGDWAVYVGILDPSDSLFNPAYSVSRIIAHEGFNSVTRMNDIALMRLSKPLDITASSNIGPVCLPNVGLNITAPQKGWITQFGFTVNGDSGPLQLMEAQVSLIETADCNSSIAYNGRISQDMLCARETEAVADKCHTDSGGPLVSLSDGVWWLTGDSIWRGHCTEQNRPGVYGNVTYFLDWIYHQMRKHQDDQR
ncbi:transmembrane protease serine 2-like [Plectropomus leopardus]|uniref:transmembrane protease serine 2-like n=1 Tax=Plectropomus leopardus TaxID=160734 RepID=UPI001C4A8C6B|nr:transmembrane protease serine 2-like [Plectropomus leopardus]XP_042342684.1 transmembrane protease serine 2-like [Plectropomus leopardus]